MTTWIILTLLLLPTLAFAAGPTVGTSCTASWSAVTQHTDGSPVSGAITYNFYLSTSTTPPASPTIPGIAATSVQPCKTLAPGQYTAWVSALETLDGSASESALSLPFSFALIQPATPTLTVR